MRKKRSKRFEIEKPIRPINSFQRYLKVQTDRQPKEVYRNFVRRVATRWLELAESEKEKYKTPVQDEENYKKALLKWKTKTRNSGRFDDVTWCY